MSTLNYLGTVLATAVIVANQGEPLDRWHAADRAIIRLDPDAFLQLPLSIRQELRRRRCTIPQSYEAAAAEGVISGRFHPTNEIDWAVLCSVDQESSILVFRGGSTKHIEAVRPPRPDFDYLQTMHDRISFSRAIRAVSETEVLRLAREDAEPAPKPPPIHDAIEDHFLGKASTRYYWRAGKWVVIGGWN